MEEHSEICAGINYMPKMTDTYAPAQDGFGERTVLICDQCEREFHIGCLAKHMQEIVTEIPQGSWYCSSECKHVSHVLQECVQRGEIPVPGSNGDHTWQVCFSPVARA